MNPTAWGAIAIEDSPTAWGATPVETPEQWGAVAVAGTPSAEFEPIVPPPPARSSEELSARNFYDTQKTIGETPTRPHYTWADRWHDLTQSRTSVGVMDKPAKTIADAFDVVKAFVTQNETLREQLGEPSREPTTTEKIAGGTQATIAETVNVFTSDLGIATLGIGTLPKAAQTLIAGAFASHMASTVPEQAKLAAEAIKAGDTEAAAKHISGVGVTATFAGLAGKHAIKGAKELLVQRAAEVGPATEAVVKGKEAVQPPPEPSVPLATAASESVKPAGVELPALAERPLPTVSTETPATQPAMAERVTELRAPDKTGLATEPPAELMEQPAAMSTGPGAASPIEFVERQTLDFSKEILPDFIERTKEREVFSQPFGAGRIPVIGKVLDPNAGVHTYEQQALAAYAAASRGVGPAQAAYIGTRFGPEIRKAFMANEAGDLNVVPRTAGQSLKISDVFEELQRNPKAYELNPEQARVWNETLKPILDAKRELVKKYELAETEDVNGDLLGHFHRVVTGFPEGKEPLLRRIGQSVGGKIPSQRGRAFTKSEQQGWEKGYKYELDPVKRLVTDIERTYKAIADKRLVEDEVFGGQTRAQLESQMREMFADDLAAGEMTERGFQNIVENRATAGRVFQPGFASKVFTPETAKLLNDTLQAGDSQLRRSIATVNDFGKALRLGFDMGVGQLQLLPSFFLRPDIWAKAQFQSAKAMLSRDVLPEYVRAHEAAVRELAQAGSSVGQMQEFMTGVAPGAAITKIPVVGPVAEAFGRQFQTALDVAKIQFWESLREVTPSDQRLQVIRTIESVLNTGRMESIGVSSRRALTERVALLAPSYYRGAVNLVAAMAEPGVSGAVARKAIMAYAGGGLALYYGIGKALGMSDEEILARLNPARADFMQWTVEGADGRKINVGIGGIHRSLLRLAGNIVKTSIEHPENWKSLAADKNPISRWLRGHLAVVPELGFTAFSGRDFMGEEADIGSITGSALPLTIQQFFRRSGEPSVTVKELAFSFAGLSAYPEAVQKQFIREREELSRSKHGKTFEAVGLSKQLEINSTLQKQAPFDKKTPATAQQITRAFQSDVERRKRITAGLTEQVLNGLSKTGTRVEGFEPTIRVGTRELYLTQNQQKRYEQLIIAEYNRVLSKAPYDRILKLDPKTRQEHIGRLVSLAKRGARAKLIAELRKQD